MAAPNTDSHGTQRRGHLEKKAPNETVVTSELGSQPITQARVSSSSPGSLWVR